jgi:hypothetical protein
VPAREPRAPAFARAALAVLAAAALGQAGALPGAAEAASAAWSPPVVLSTCLGSGPARAAFPRNSPTHATGVGAVVWSGARSCPQGAGTLVSRIGRSDLPGPAAYARAPDGHRLSLHAPLALAPAPHGQIAIAGSASSTTSADGLLVQGGAGGPFATLGTLAGTVAESGLFTAYLGDVALASASPSPSPSGSRRGVQVRVERYFAGSLSPALNVAAPAGGNAESLTVSLDFRTDAIAVWRQGGALYARDLPASGRVAPTQRLAAAAPAPRIAALISDNNRAIVAWADERAGTTSVYLDYSASGVRFGRPQLLERFANPAGLPYPRTSPRLVRLSSESVMLAWTGAQQGHWVVRTAPIDLNGLRKVSTISDPSADSLLSDLAPGPDGEAIALWGQPQPTPQGLDATRQAIIAARGIDASPGRTIFQAPEPIAAPGANSEASVAFDPASDRAIALWRGEGGSLQYAVRTPARP